MEIVALRLTVEIVYHNSHFRVVYLGAISQEFACMNLCPATPLQILKPCIQRLYIKVK